ncbi:hypothetical protein DNH61_10025 [Paenibacillus sambharensis]|uniref:Uncharacterized protein n=1 Tax=Paenibacillus sambharensis TaxID=1803190 RepID=A0A2W1L972_9BACL|nr:hypothetical protein [Paenibacillus sambharensis]PZD95786.1 hypothetical protein DNH61_10025 [Paenibacillus sambharensis]
MKDTDHSGDVRAAGKQIPDRLSSRSKEGSTSATETETNPAQGKTIEPAARPGASEDWQKLFAAVRSGLERLRE